MSPGWEPSLRPDGRALAEARALMGRFAERTGLVGERSPRRYLWTDAFAVCNDLALWWATGDPQYRQAALSAVDQVHAVLGRHRSDDARSGWISGLSEQAGALHPTRGGLRIGKKLPERAPGAPFDERLEWDRDGQYFHYLTRWMHALDQVARATGEVRFNVWARELADVAHRAFTRPGPGGRGMAWKMSIDLSRSLVPSMGQHDPLDGFVTCLELRATAAALSAPAEPSLDDALSDFAHLLEGQSLVTADPLGLGGLLQDAGRVAQLWQQGAPSAPELLAPLLGAAQAGLEHFERWSDRAPAERRLAFRELGLAIGLRVLGPLQSTLGSEGRELPGRARVLATLEALAPHAATGARITAFWRDPAHRATPIWAEHQDIDDVMLATSLAPAGVLALGGGR